MPKLTLRLQLFNTVGKTSGFVGPFVTSAIINRSSGNQNLAFWFLFGMGLAGCAVLALVNPNKAKIDAVRCEQGFREESEADLRPHQSLRGKLRTCTVYRRSTRREKTSSRMGSKTGDWPRYILPKSRLPSKAWTNSTHLIKMSLHSRPEVCATAQDTCLKHNLPCYTT